MNIDNTWKGHGWLITVCVHCLVFVLHVDVFDASRIVVQAFYGQKLVNLPQIATEANSTDMIS